MLATDPRPSVRNGEIAVEFGRRLLEASGGQEPVILDTLAAAYAETGRFSEATETARRGLALANTQKNLTLANALQARIKLYQSGSPFRETRKRPSAANP